MKTQRRTVFALYGCMVVLYAACPQSAQAQIAAEIAVQQVQVIPPGFEGGPAASSTREMQELLDLRIDALQRIVGIDEAQAAKLRMAAAAATKDVFANPEKHGVPKGKIQFQIQGFGFGGPEKKADEPSLSDEDAESTENADGGNENAMDLTMPIPLGVVLNHEIWTKAVSSVLSAEQQAAADKLWQERKEASRRAAVTRHVDVLDEQLLLSPEQRTKVTEIVAAKLASQPVLPAFIPIIGNGAEINLGAVTADDLSSVLSDAQMARYKKQKANEANPLAGLGAIAPMVQAAVGKVIPGGDEAGALLGVRVTDENDKVVIKEVIAGGLGEKFGFKVGDLVTGFNDTAVEKASQLGELLLKAIPSNKPPKIEVERGNETLTLQLP